MQLAIDDTNRMHGRELGYRIDMLHWKTDAFPAVGADGQDVINQQIGDYDVLLGLMSTRYGSPTGRSDSGTVEEFDRAWARLVRHPNSLSIAFYFRDPLVRLSSIDGYELLQIQRFQRRVRELGILHGIYDDPNDLGLQLRNHLPSTMRAIMAGSSAVPAVQQGLASTPVTVTLADWHARQNVFPQWADRRTVPLEHTENHSYSLDGVFLSISPYFRFGFRLFPRDGKEWGDGMVTSREGANLVVHIGKNVESPSLFVTSYLNASRQTSNVPLFAYEPPRPVPITVRVSEDYVFTMTIDGSQVLQMHINPLLTQRLNMVAWGDEHEFEVHFTEIRLTTPSPSR